MYISKMCYPHLDNYGGFSVSIDLGGLDRDTILKFEECVCTSKCMSIIPTSGTPELEIPLFKRSNSTDDLKVTKVIYNNPATIVFWSDGTKTVVKCGKDDTYDKEKGFYIACAKKLFGNDYKAVGRMNKALEMAEDKNDIKKTFDRLKKALEITEDKNG